MPGIAPYWWIACPIVMPGIAPYWWIACPIARIYRNAGYSSLIILYMHEAYSTARAVTYAVESWTIVYTGYEKDKGRNMYTHQL